MSSRVLATETATPDLYTLSLHDALPIYARPRERFIGRERRQLQLYYRLAWAIQSCRDRRRPPGTSADPKRSEEHTSELQSLTNLVCRLLLEKKNINEHHVSNVQTTPHQP